VTYRKKLIEVALPLEAINKESLHRKQKAPKGFPTSFHKWWAQRPLAACRAVVFASLVDDPSSRPDRFRTEPEQDAERERLCKLIEQLVLWDNSGNEQLLAAAWKEILVSCDGVPPLVCDPFAGGGSIPLEAQRLGLQVYASDLNPVAVAINKGLIEAPWRFAVKGPVNPSARKAKQLVSRSWTGAQGIADDVRYYGNWLRAEAERRIGKLYPSIEISKDMAKGRRDLSPLVGNTLNPVAWLWTRTVRSPNPAFANVHVPLASTFALSSKAGREAYVQPVVEDGSYRFVVKLGTPKGAKEILDGTKFGRGNFRCIMSGEPISAEYIRKEGQAGRLGSRLMAIVAEGERSRVYLSPTIEQEAAARKAKPTWKPDVEFFQDALGFRVGNYGFSTWGDLFTDRQSVALATFCDLVHEASTRVFEDAVAAGAVNDGASFESGGLGARAYADVIALYLATAIDRVAYYGSSLTTWLPKDNALRDCMPRQALQMVWDYAEGNPLGKSSGDFLTCLNVVANYLDVATPRAEAVAVQEDARRVEFAGQRVLFCTDPPYYDNIGYADLSDYFYVWLRRSLRSMFPALFSTVSTPKAAELVATPARHGGRGGAEAFFLDGVTEVMHRLSDNAHPDFPVVIFYAFKQAEGTDDEEGTASTGWETFLEGVIKSGLGIVGTWPVRTEGAGRMRANESNALASSVVLVCRRRSVAAPVTTRREFVAVLKRELPLAVAHLQRSNIAPVDLQQSAIGPGMSVYTRYSQVLDAQGNAMRVREALTLINRTLDEVLAEQEGDFDADTRWAVSWFEQFGFAEGEYGVAETLSKAKNTSVSGIVEAGVAASKAGKVRLLKPSELPEDWNPEADSRLTTWEVVHHLLRVLAEGEEAAAAMTSKLGAHADVARELAYRLYSVCERRKRAPEALAYNSLVQSWPEIMRLAREAGAPKQAQATLFAENEE
jgi:putative DNA methylase